VDDDGDVAVPFCREDEVIEALGVDVPVPDVADDPQIRVSHAYSRRRRDRTAVDAVETVDVQVIG